MHISIVLPSIQSKANMGGKVLASLVMPQVQQLLSAEAAPNFVRKKSSLALLKLFRAAPFEPEQQFVLDVVKCLMHADLGVVMSVTSLIIAMTLNNSELWGGCVPLVINRLHRLMMASEPTQSTGEGVLPQDSDYMYVWQLCPPPPMCSLRLHSTTLSNVC